MNKKRRKAIKEIIDQLEMPKEQIVSVSEEEQEAFDNLPENIQYSERGEAMSEAVFDLDNTASYIDSIIDSLQDIIER